MKRFLKRIFVFFVIIGTIFTLSACSSTANISQSTTSSQSAVADVTPKIPEEYIKGFLDSICKSDYKGYADVNGFTIDEVKESIPEYFLTIIDENIPYQIEDETELNKFADSLQKIYAKTDYTVESSKESKDGSYIVPVKIKKLVIFKDAIKNGNKKYNAWVKKQSDDLEEEKATAKFIDFIIEECNKQLENPTYKNETIVNVNLAPTKDLDSESLFTYNDEDISKLLSTLVDLSSWEDEVDEDDK